MQEAIYVTVFGVARVFKNSGPKAIYTDKLSGDLIIVAVHKDMIQLIRCNRNINGDSIAETFQGFPQPYELLIAYNSAMLTHLPMIAASSSPYSNENILERLKEALNKQNLPVWKKVQIIPLQGQALGIELGGNTFHNANAINPLRAPNFSIREDIDFLNHLMITVSSSGGADVIAFKLDLQYSDKGWTPMPVLSDVLTKSCILLKSLNYRSEGFINCMANDKDLSLYAKNIEGAIPSEEALVRKLKGLINFFEKNSPEKFKGTTTDSDDSSKNQNSTGQTTKEPLLVQRGTNKTLIDKTALTTPCIINETLYVHVMQSKIVRWDEKVSPEILKGIGTSDFSACNIVVVVGGGSMVNTYRASMIHADRSISAKHINEECAWVGEDPQVYIFRKNIPTGLLWLSRNQNELNVEPVISYLKDEVSAISLTFSKLLTEGRNEGIFSFYPNMKDLPFTFVKHPNELKARAVGQINWVFTPEQAHAPISGLLFDSTTWLDLPDSELTLAPQALHGVTQIGEKGFYEGLSLLRTIFPVDVAATLQASEVDSISIALMPYIQEYNFEYQFSDIMTSNLNALSREIANLIKTPLDQKIQNLLKKYEHQKGCPIIFLEYKILPLCTDPQSEYQTTIKQAFELFLNYVSYASSAESSQSYVNDAEKKANDFAASGVNYFKEKNYNKAFVEFNRALIYAQLIYTQTHKSLGTAYHNLGSVCHESYLANPQEASLLHRAYQYLTQARSIREKNNASELQKTLSRLNQIEIMQKDNPHVPAKPVDPNDVAKLLRLVAEGEQDQVEAMIKDNPALLLQRGDVTDLSKFTFNGITAFQYAVWALDWHMWRMILKYLPKEEAAKQAAQFETGSWVATHGITASWKNLIDALEEYRRAYFSNQRIMKTMNNQRSIVLLWQENGKFWVKKVGGAQLSLPAHVVNEYCYPLRGFHPTPSFEEWDLPRIRTADGKADWFEAKLGAEKAASRGSWPKCCYAPMNDITPDSPVDPVYDSVALSKLLAVRTRQRDELISSLKLSEKPVLTGKTSVFK